MSSLGWSSLDPLDATFVSTLQTVQSLYVTLPRSSQIRVELWCTQLSQECAHNTWRKSRNLYGELLLLSVQRGVLCPPFDKLPTTGPLPKLPPEITLSLRCSRNKAGVTKKSVPLPHLPHSTVIWNTIFSRVGLDEKSKYKESVSKPLQPPREEKCPPSFSYAHTLSRPFKMGKKSVSAELIDSNNRGTMELDLAKTPQWENSGNNGGPYDVVHGIDNNVQSTLDISLVLATEALMDANIVCAATEAKVKALLAQQLPLKEDSAQASLPSSSSSLALVESSSFPLSPRLEKGLISEETLSLYVGELRALRAHLAQFF